MSWLYSQALVVAFSEATCSDGAPSALSSVTPTPQAFLSPDRMTAFSRLSRFGMTFAPLTDDLGADVLTWCLVDSLARISARPAKAQESLESAADSGQSLPESLAKFDPVSRSWKTAQCSLFEDWASSLETWPRWGMTHDGACWAQTMSAHLISETESGSWPTPTVNGWRVDQGQTTEAEAMAMGSLRPPRMEMWPTPRTQMTRSVQARSDCKNGHKSNLEEVVAIRMWPTPRSCSAMAATITPESAWNQDRFPNLETVVGRSLWPTPVANHAKKRGDFDMMNPRNGLGAAVKRETFTTPTAHNAKQCNAASESQRNTPTLAAQVGGSLNPTWVECLMGWPLGWTDLRPLVTAKCPNALHSHGAPCQRDSTAPK